MKNQVTLIGVYHDTLGFVGYLQNEKDGIYFAQNPYNDNSEQAYLTDECFIAEQIIKAESITDNTINPKSNE